MWLPVPQSGSKPEQQKQRYSPHGDGYDPRARSKMKLLELRCRPEPRNQECKQVEAGNQRKYASYPLSPPPEIEDSPAVALLTISAVLAREWFPWLNILGNRVTSLATDTARERYQTIATVAAAVHPARGRVERLGVLITPTARRVADGVFRHSSRCVLFARLSASVDALRRGRRRDTTDPLLSARSS